MSVKPSLGAAPSVHILGNGKMAARTSQLLLSFSTVIKVVIGEERCVTTLITAAREIINHDDLP